MKTIILTYKAMRRLRSELSLALDKIRTRFLFAVNGIAQPSDLSTKGTPQIHVGENASCTIGAGLRINNGLKYNKIGRQSRSQIIVGAGASLHIGAGVGVSSSAIICHHKITIGHRVLIGGNVVIYDTDFHSLNPDHRRKTSTDEANRSYAPVWIGDDVFIGAHSTILKGVHIGEGAIIGACSVVTKDIPAGEIWAGNPAKFIRKQKTIQFAKIA